ncbi:hypothetical protein PG989_007074 [Apiospora arundinis]
MQPATPPDLKLASHHHFDDETRYPNPERPWSSSLKETEDAPGNDGPPYVPPKTIHIFFDHLMAYSIWHSNKISYKTYCEMESWGSLDRIDKFIIVTWPLMIFLLLVVPLMVLYQDIRRLRGLNSYTYLIQNW